MVVQNPMLSTEYVVANEIDFKLRLLERSGKKKFTYIKPKYIFNCIKAEKLLPLSPIYLTIFPKDEN